VARVALRKRAQAALLKKLFVQRQRAATAIAVSAHRGTKKSGALPRDHDAQTKGVTHGGGNYVL